MSGNQEFYFEQQSIVFAYSGDHFAGVLVTYPGESFTKKELLDYFEEAEPDYLVAANLAEWFYTGDEDEVKDRIQMLIEMAMEGDTSHLSVLYHIPKHLH